MASAFFSAVPLPYLLAALSLAFMVLATGLVRLDERRGRTRTTGQRPSAAHEMTVTLASDGAIVPESHASENVLAWSDQGRSVTRLFFPPDATVDIQIGAASSAGRKDVER